MQIDFPRNVIFKKSGTIIVRKIGYTGKHTYFKTKRGNRGSEQWQLLTKLEKEWRLKESYES